MVKFTATAISLLMLTMAPAALGKNCKGSLMYCGRGLLNKGNYYDQIIEALQGAGQSTDSSHVNNSMFYCKSDGNIVFQAYCQTSGCINGGADHSDYC
ncbi:hypothetical protein B0T21DRAFT_412988 [Apiosordaria backusii]|uniref:Uncharacterized protein n=1 Tax=Apiosordaria backusii TaxID=314023 RepID=A0AA40BEQ8_9PEZI|nr:hypothetical protein B0T21DRAFT_412988 [Apiosordaria backusii]